MNQYHDYTDSGLGFEFIYRISSRLNVYFNRSTQEVMFHEYHAIKLYDSVFPISFITSWLVAAWRIKRYIS